MQFTGSVHSAFGLLALTALAWVLSENRAAAKLQIALAGIGLQLLIAGILLGVPVVREAFAYLNGAVLALQDATEAGGSFVFGYLAGGPLPFEETSAGASFILAFRALPLVIIVSALTAVLTHWRVLPLIVKGFALLLQRTLGIGGAVGLGTAANVFVGMVEAPLFVRDYLDRLSRGELFTLMCAGMATIAGTVLVLYAGVLQASVPDVAGHLLTASIISVPAAITIAKLMVPDEGTTASADATISSPARSTMDAITTGTQNGLQLYLHIVAMLLVLVALVHLVNALLGTLPEFGQEPLTLQRVLGYGMAPIAWLMGIPWSEATAAGALLGTKVVLNEFLAYLDLVALPEGTLGERSRTILTYALCGFANFGSLGIMIGGLTTIAPRRRREILELGPRSIAGGTLATCCTGAVVGVFT